MKIKNLLLLISIVFALISCDNTIENEKPKDQQPPSDVTTLKDSAINHKIFLTWIDPADFDLKEIEVHYQSQKKIVQKGIQMIVIDSLTNNQLYEFTLISVDSSGNKSSGLIIKSTPVFKPDFSVSNYHISWGDEDPYEVDFVNMGGSGEIEVKVTFEKLQTIYSEITKKISLVEGQSGKLFISKHSVQTFSYSFVYKLTTYPIVRVYINQKECCSALLESCSVVMVGGLQKYRTNIISSVTFYDILI
jgi:hypothetical protein